MNIKTIISSTFKALAIVLTLAVLFPSAVKLTHAFNHHQHEVCENDNTSNTHFHEADIDCDFYKFKLTKNQFFIVSKYEIKTAFVLQDQRLDYYSSFKNYKQSSRHLRGPPQLV